MSTRREYDSIEEYLERLRALLAGMPQDEIDEALEEMGQHLQTLVEAEAGPGVSYPDAARRAVSKFGAPEVIAREELLGYLQRLGAERTRQARKRSMMFLVSYGIAMAMTLELIIMVSSRVSENSLAFTVLSVIALGLVIGVFMGLGDSQSPSTAIAGFLNGMSDDQRQAILSGVHEARPACDSEFLARTGVLATATRWRKRALLGLARRLSGRSHCCQATTRESPVRLIREVAQYGVIIGCLALISPSFRNHGTYLAMIGMSVSMCGSKWVAKQVVYARNLKRSIAE